MLPCPLPWAFHLYLHSKYRICTYLIPLEKCKRFKIDVVACRWTAQGKVLIGKTNIDMDSQHEEEEPNGRYKEQRSAEDPHSSEPQKAHLTSEFVAVS